MNTPEEKILKETLQYNEISHEVSVSPFCLKNVPEHPENKENLDLPSNWYFLVFLSFLKKSY